MQIVSISLRHNPRADVIITSLFLVRVYKGGCQVNNKLLPEKWVNSCETLGNLVKSGYHMTLVLSAHLLTLATFP